MSGVPPKFVVSQSPINSEASTYLLITLGTCKNGSQLKSDVPTLRREKDKLTKHIFNYLPNNIQNVTVGKDSNGKTGISEIRTGTIALVKNTHPDRCPIVWVQSRSTKYLRNLGEF